MRGTRSTGSIRKTCRWCISLVVVALALRPVPGRAGRETEEDRFLKHYERGMHLYSDERYEEAIKEFHDAYGVRDSPRILFNLGQAHRNLGHAREALHFYLLYQTREPNPKPGLKAELDGYILQLKDAITKAEQAKHYEEQVNQETQPAGPPPAVTGTPPAPLTVASGPAPAGPQAGPVVTAPAPRRQPVYRRWWFWTAIGGVVAAAVAIGAGVGASRYHGPIDNY